MVPSLEKQNQLLSHDLVTRKKQHLFNEQSNYAFLRQITATIKVFLCCFLSDGISFLSITSVKLLSLKDVLGFYHLRQTWNLRLDVVMVNFCV